MNTASKPIRVLTSVIGFSLMIVTWIVSFSVQCVARAFICPFLDKPSASYLLGWIFRFISSFVIRLNPFWRVSVVGPRPEEPSGALLVCNHLSNADAYFLSAALLPWETKYIAKASLFDVPFGGWAMRLAGDLPVHFTWSKADGWGVRKGTVGKMMQQAKRYLQEGLCIAVFPEGGRTEDGKLRPFKDGFFNLAVDAQASVLPCALVGTEEAWPIHQALLGPASVYVRIGKPIPAKGHTAESLKLQVREAVLALQADLPAPKWGAMGKAEETVPSQ